MNQPTPEVWIHLEENDPITRAVAVIAIDGQPRMRRAGEARRHPNDAPDLRVGSGYAVARALIALGEDWKDTTDELVADLALNRWVIDLLKRPDTRQVSCKPLDWNDLQRESKATWPRVCGWCGADIGILEPAGLPTRQARNTHNVCEEEHLADGWICRRHFPHEHRTTGYDRRNPQVVDRRTWTADSRGGRRQEATRGGRRSTPDRRRT